jgi:hypothetical protein
LSCIHIDTNDKIAAIREATPAMIIVALVSLPPVPDGTDCSPMILIILAGRAETKRLCVWIRSMSARCLDLHHDRARPKPEQFSKDGRLRIYIVA